LDDGEVDLQFGMGVPEIGAGPAHGRRQGLRTKGLGGVKPDAAPGSTRPDRRVLCASTSEVNQSFWSELQQPRRASA
jgi:hypothetical protein